MASSGILISLALPMYVAYCGANELLLALAFDAGPDLALMLATYTQFVMTELGIP